MANTNGPELGLYGYFGYRIPFANRLAMIAEAGFTHTSFWWPDDTPEVRTIRHEAPPAARDVGLTVDSLHAPYKRAAALWNEDATVRRDALDAHRACLDDCARHAIPRLVMHVALGPATPPPTPQALDSFKPLIEHAQALDVTICVENTRSPTHAEALFHTFDTSHLALCYDTSHDVLYAGEPLALLDAWAHRVAAVHLNDTNGRRDRHWLPGEGVVDFPRVTQRLRAAEFTGPWMLEVVGAPQTESPESFLARAYECAVAVSTNTLAINAAQ